MSINFHRIAGLALAALLSLLALNAQAANSVSVLTITETLPAPTRALLSNFDRVPWIQSHQSLLVRHYGSGHRPELVRHRYQRAMTVRGIDHRGVMRVWVNSVTITVPGYVAGGWDVRALQRELERLGVKVKPKPVTPKPGPQVSG